MTKTYRIYFDEGTPPIIRKAKNEENAFSQGLDYLDKLVGEPKFSTMEDDFISAFESVGHVECLK